MTEDQTVASDRPISAYLFLGAGMVSVALSAVLIRYASEGPPLTIAVWRTGLSVLFLLPFSLPRIHAEVRRFSHRDLTFIGLAGVFLALHFILWIESIFHTSIASATVLVTTSSIFAPILGFLILKERISWQKSLAVAIAFGGSMLLTTSQAGPDFPRAWFGNLLALTAAFLFTVYLILGRVIRRKTSWLAYVFPVYTVVAVIVLVVAWMRDTPLWGFSPSFYGLCALMALIPQIVGHGSFNYAVRYFPVGWLGVAGLSEPVLASVLAFLLFAEIPTLTAFIGMITVLSGIAFIFFGTSGKTRNQ
jgi:drug/metabolite transporter (DMT)-like permease